MMRRSTSAILLCVSLAAGGCTGIVDEEQMRVFFSRLGNVSMTVYPAYVKKREPGSHYVPAEAERLAEFLSSARMADARVATTEIPVGHEWHRTQLGNWKASIRAFAKHVADHPIDTDYAMMAEYLMPGNKVWAVHAYIVSAAGDIVWGLHLNEHFDIFTDIDPRTPAEGTDVLLAWLRANWPSPVPH